jgi:excisionase family DNA binding protein
MEAALPHIRILRPDEVAEILRLSKPRIYQLAEEGKIASIRIGKSIRFQLDDVQTFIRTQRRETRET